MTQAALAKFTLDTSSGDPIALLGDTELDVVDAGEDGHVIAECDQGALSTACLDGFPEALTLQIHSMDGFGTFLFHEVEIYRDKVGRVVGTKLMVSGAGR